MERCTGAVLITSVPAAWADPLIPEGFSPYPLVVDAYQASVRVHDCDRAILGRHIDEGFAWMTVSVAVFQDMDPESERLTLLHIASFMSSGTTQAGLAALGVDVREATLARQTGAGVAGPAWLGWSIDAVEFQAGFGFSHLAIPQGSSSTNLTTWYPADQPVKQTMDADQTLGHLVDADATWMTLEGNTPANQLFGQNPAWAFSAQANWDSSYRFYFEGSR